MELKKFLKNSLLQKVYPFCKNWQVKRIYPNTSIRSAIASFTKAKMHESLLMTIRHGKT